MKKTQIIAIILVAISLAVVIALVTDAKEYQTFASAKELPEGKHSTIMGELVALDKIQYNPEINPNLTTFYVKDREGTVMKVNYFEPKPIDFERSEDVTITGEIVGDEFHAHNMLVKCPSKYVEDDLSAQNSK